MFEWSEVKGCGQLFVFVFLSGWVIIDFLFNSFGFSKRVGVNYLVCSFGAIPQIWLLSITVLFKLSHSAMSKSTVYILLLQSIIIKTNDNLGRTCMKRWIKIEAPGAAQVVQELNICPPLQRTRFYSWQCHTSQGVQIKVRDILENSLNLCMCCTFPVRLVRGSGFIITRGRTWLTKSG